MKILGLQVPFTRPQIEKAFNYVMDNRGGWYSILEPYGGAWQRNIRIDRNLAQTFHAVFACQTLIASDIAKLRVKLVEQDDDGIWTETKNPAYDPVLRKPNAYQNRIQFLENWMHSKLSRGNTYVLKGRDLRGVVNALYVLDPSRVRPLVSDIGGAVFYQLDSDNLTSIDTQVTVPAREIIHDRMNCFFHPLVGVPPIYSCGLAAMQGYNIQTHSTKLFENNSTPGGLLSAPGLIDDITAKRIKADWELNFSGKNLGRVAVLGDGMKYEKMALSAVEGQLIEQLKLTAEIVCSTFHVPPYKIGVGQLPSYNNIQALNVEYYTQCLQVLIESAELCLDEGLEMAGDIGTEFDLDNLLRMDTVTQVAAEKEAISAGIKSPNEARRRFDLKPVPGGETPYLQQQNFSLAALAKRDAQDDPFSSGKSTPPASANSANDVMPPEDVAAAKQIAAWRLKELLAS